MKTGSSATSPAASEPRSRLPAFVLSAALVCAYPFDARADEPHVEACIKSHFSGQVAQREGRLREARSAFARCAAVECPEVIRQECNELARDTDRKIPSVILAARSSRGDEFDVHVTMDRERIAETLDGKEIEIEAGRHVFVFEHPELGSVEVNVVIRVGEKSRLVVGVFESKRVEAPAQVPTPDKTPTSKTIEEPGPILWPTYVAGGLALAGLGVFIGFGAKGLSTRSDLMSDSGCAPFCKDEDLSGMRRDFLIADIGLAVAVASTTAAILTFALRPTKKRVVPIAGMRLNADRARSGSPSGGIVGIRGAF